MQIRIATGDGRPIYRQIVEQVHALVASGRLAPGEEMPPIRVLAERLLVNPNTVARAYRELEAAGLVTKRRTAGTYVADSALAAGLADRLALIAGRVDDLLEEAGRLGIGLADLLASIEARDASRRTGPTPGRPER